MAKSILKQIRDSFGLIAAAYGSIPFGFAGREVQVGAEIPPIQTKVELPHSVGEALYGDFERIGGDLKKSISAFQASHEQ